ncbi:MAG: hypothetical protein Q8Q31_03465 [Nanoarchaeota archaeon]|nr:hypothetical protein [Nanoarchaeota archaeon]
MGHILYCSPQWFYGYDIILEVVFALITLAVALYSFKIYRLCGQRESRLFGTAFLLISVSYSLWAILNGFAVSELENARTILEIEKANIWRYLGVYAHIFFFLGGVTTIAYMTLKDKNARLYSLLFILVLAGVVFAEQKYLATHILSVILLLYIMLGYTNQYSENKNKKVFLTLLAFTFLFLGRFEFIFSPSKNVFYVVGHVLEFAAYLLILTSLIMVIKQGNRKKITVP